MKKSPPLILLGLVVLVSTLVCVLSLLNVQNAIKFDSVGYLELADGLTHHQKFTRATEPPFEPEASRLPGYSIFLGVMKLFGEYQIYFAILIQCCIPILALYIVWPLFYKWGGRWGAIAGSVFLTLDYVILMHINLILAEGLFLLFLILGVKYSILLIENKSHRHALLAGLWWSLASMVKPISFFIPIFMVFILYRQIKPLLMFLGTAYLLPALWITRNIFLFGGPILTIQSGTDLLQYPASFSVVMKTNRPHSEVYKEILDQIEEEHPEVKDDMVLRNKLYTEKAKEIIFNNFFYTVKYCAFGVVRILGGTGLEMSIDLVGVKNEFERFENDGANLKGRGTRVLLKNYPILWPFLIGYLLFLLSMYGLFSWGIIQLLKDKNFQMAFFIIIFAGVFLALLSTQGYYRFRIPIMPFFAMGAVIPLKRFD